MRIKKAQSSDVYFLTALAIRGRKEVSDQLTANSEIIPCHQFSDFLHAQGLLDNAWFSSNFDVSSFSKNTKEQQNLRISRLRSSKLQISDLPRPRCTPPLAGVIFSLSRLTRKLNFGSEREVTEPQHYVIFSCSLVRWFQQLHEQKKMKKWPSSCSSLSRRLSLSTSDDSADSGQAYKQGNSFLAPSFYLIFINSLYSYSALSVRSKVPEVKRGRSYGESEGENSVCSFLSNSRIAPATCHCFNSGTVPTQGPCLVP